MTNARDWTLDTEFEGTPIYMTFKAMQAWSPRYSRWNEKQEHKSWETSIFNGQVKEEKPVKENEEE